MFCIRCGNQADGTVALHCSACGFTHYLNSKIGSSALVVHHDRYLVMQRAKEPEAGKWDIPGGFCDYGEAPDATARREVFEETGYLVQIGELLGVWMDEYQEPDGNMWPTINLVYVARLVGEQPDTRHIDPAEVAAIDWVPVTNPGIVMAFPIQQNGALERYRFTL